MCYYLLSYSRIPPYILKISFFGCFILPIRLSERGLISNQNFLRI